MDATIAIPAWLLAPIIALIPGLFGKLIYDGIKNNRNGNGLLKESIMILRERSVKNEQCQKNIEDHLEVFAKGQHETNELLRQLISKHPD